MEEKKYASPIRLRVSAKDIHYGGNLVGSTHMMHPFGDVTTELLIQYDGDGGLPCAYSNIESKTLAYADGFIGVYGEITYVGNTSHKMKFEARKMTTPRPDISDSAVDFLAKSIMVAVAEGTCATPEKYQYIPH